MSLNKNSKYDGQSFKMPKLSREGKIATTLGVIVITSLIIALCTFTAESELGKVGAYSPNAYPTYAEQLVIRYGAGTVEGSLVKDIQIIGEVGNLIEEYEEAKEVGDMVAAKAIADKVFEQSNDITKAALEIAKRPFIGETVIQRDPEGIYKFKNGGEYYTPKGTSKDLVKAILAAQGASRNGSYSCYINNPDTNWQEAMEILEDLIIATQTDFVADHDKETSLFGNTITGEVRTKGSK